MHSIYKITNPDGMVYIGRTKSLRKRYSCYNTMTRTKSQPILHKSLFEHGFKNHKFEVIETVDCLEMANEREIFHIAIYMSKGISLNGTKGGNNACETIKVPIVKFNINGDYVQEYESIAVAARDVSTFPQNIQIALSNNRHYSKGFYWMYKSDYIKNGVADFKLKRSCRKKSLQMFDLKNGNFIAEFNSPMEAHKSTGIARSSIINCLNGFNGSAFGYVFKYIN